MITEPIGKLAYSEAGRSLTQAVVETVEGQLGDVTEKWQLSLATDAFMCALASMFAEAADPHIELAPEAFADFVRVKAMQWALLSHIDDALMDTQ